MQFNDILTLVFSSGALFFSFLNYKQGKRFENENFIYKTKVEVYIKILGELDKLLGFLEDNIEEAREYLKKPNDENYEYLNDLADEVDKKCIEFNTFITGNSLIIPEKIVILLSRFCDKVLSTETLDSEIKSISKSIEAAEKMLNELVDDADNISVELRKDLHINELNSSLYRRLK